MDWNQPRSKLPIGIQTFREIRTDGLRYVDKTPFAFRLVQEGKYNVLFRPRRFGKSLFVSMLQDLFECRRRLFRGLAIEPHWDWSSPRPVVRLDFAAGSFGETDGLHKNFLRQLRSHERVSGIRLASDRGPDRFAELLELLHERTGRRVVVLVDEYDSPIVEVLSNPALAKANRDYLRSVYAAVKSCDAHVKFLFLTGIPKFSKVRIFSGLNNLRDITLNPAYSSICGYAEHDLDTVFHAELAGLDRGEIRAWYKGYTWGAEERVYNPFDVLLLLQDRMFKPWWFETGTPSFLITTILERGIATPELDGMIASEELLSSFDVDSISTEALLFQSGYLTLVSSEIQDGNQYYRLGYPNREVRKSLNQALLGALVPRLSGRALENCTLFAKHLREAEFGKMERALRGFFASIPHDWHRRNDIATYEGYYASVFYSLVAGFGLDATAEDSSSSGRLDMALRTGGKIFLFEFKVQERAGPGAALEQLRRRGYATKYQQYGQPVYLVGVEFSAKTRNVARIEAALA